jgi:magnesium transporter
MIQAYSKNQSVLTVSGLHAGEALPKNLVWLDLLEPTRDEEVLIETLTGIEVPTREDMQEIEESSRLYSEGGAQYMTAPLLHSLEPNKAGMMPVTFILANGYLITVRYSSPRAFRLFEARAVKSGNDIVTDNCDGLAILLGLLESVTDRAADLLEDVALRLDRESESLFSDSAAPMTTARFRGVMRLLGQEGSFLSKVGESLSGLDRLIAYLGAQMKAPKRKAITDRLASMEKDIHSLNRHAEFLSGKITFLLDTVVGLVSVEQNGIIKIFSVAAVAFMPPTLVASLYGMNFKFMPELDWPYGYPMAIGLMVISALIPLMYFKYRRWL